MNTARFCPSCGAKTEAVLPRMPPAPPAGQGWAAASPSGAVRPRKKGRLLKRLLIAVGALIAAFIVLTIAVFAISGDDGYGGDGGYYTEDYETGDGDYGGGDGGYYTDDDETGDAGYYTDDYEYGDDGAGSQPVSDGGGREWALYWYLCGSDLESGDGAASSDLAELRAVKLPPDVAVIVQTGGTAAWRNNINPNIITRFIYDSEGFRKLEEVSDNDFSSPNTLRDFLRFCKQYPARKTGVIIWDHGGGSLGGAVFDEKYAQGGMSLPQIQAAFDAAGGRYEFIGFDACLMATIDTAAVFSGRAKWLVASQETEPGFGWDYTGFMKELAKNPGMGGGELGKFVCDTYFAYGKKEGYSADMTLSVTDLDAVPALLAAYDTAGEHALRSAGAGGNWAAQFGRAATQADSYSASDGFNMVDLGDIAVKAANLLDQSGRAIRSALEKAVTYQIRGPAHSSANGLSCFYPLDGDRGAAQTFAALNTSPAFTQYFNYILAGRRSVPVEVQNYTSREGSRAIEIKPLELPDPELLNNHPLELYKEGNNAWCRLNLGPELAGQLVSVYGHLYLETDTEGTLLYLGVADQLDISEELLNMTVAELGRDSTYMLMLRARRNQSLGKRTEPEQGVYAPLPNLALYMIVTAWDQTIQLSIAHTGHTDEADSFSAPILLNGERYDLLMVKGKYDMTPKITGCRKPKGASGMASKELRMLQPGDRIEAIYYYVRQETGEWVEMLDTAIIVGEDSPLISVTLLWNSEYMFRYEMKDVQNTSYYSEWAGLTVQPSVFNRNANEFHFYSLANGMKKTSGFRFGAMNIVEVLCFPFWKLRHDLNDFLTSWMVDGIENHGVLEMTVRDFLKKQGIKGL
jgi:hypothetical protein